MRIVGALLLVPLAMGCRQLFGIDDTTVAGDAALDDATTADAASDAAAMIPDAAVDGGPMPDATLATCTGYTAIAGGFPAGATYKGGSSTIQWPQARANCQADGAELVVIDNAIEAGAVATLAPDTISPFFWVGVYDPPGGADNDWITVRGAAPTYLPWAAAQPSGGNQDCALLSDSGAPHELFDFTCGSPQVYVCECLP